MKRTLLTIGSLLLLLPLLVAQQQPYKVVKHNRISTGMDEAAAVRYGEEDIVYITQSASVGASSGPARRRR